MSKYTTEVRFICENAAGYDESKGFNDVDEIIESSIPSIFSFSFPIFDENYRNVICSKILRHYYTREIGFETVGLWKLKLQTKLNEIMPYFNKLYESELIKFNPLYDVDLNTTHVGDKNSESTKTESGTSNTSNSGIGTDIKSGNNTTNSENTDVSNINSTGNASGSENGNTNGTKASANNYEETNNDLHYDLYSDTPQGALDGVDEEEYLTNARKITDSKSKTGKNDNSDVTNENYSKNNSSNNTENVSGSNVGESKTDSSFDERNERNTMSESNSEDNRNSNDKFNSTESYVVHVVGKQGGASYSKLLTEFRNTFLNIDMDVINSLSDLFFNLW